MILYYLLLMILIVFMILMAFYVFSSLYSLAISRGVPYVPLSKKKLKFLREKIKLPNDCRLVDLGCGNGRVMRFFEKQGINNVDGYEINGWALLWGKFLNFIFHSKTKIYSKNFNKIDLSKYDVVFCYLLDNALLSLREKFDRELKHGTKIITYDFAIGDWHKSVQYFESPEKWVGRIYVYEI
ncbi:MAG: hypothetical protein WCT18_05110 [Patescibacteria group bacterium]